MVVILSEIRGQDRAVAQLRSAMDRQRVAHAYLFCGPPGSGKHTTGLALAAALNCTEEPGSGCHRCGPCNKIAEGIHPDITTLERQGAARIIPIATIRTQVIPRLGMPPHEGRARVFLIGEATALQGPAANALLKTLEEPPARTHFVLATTSPDQLLPTIRSRCQRINFAALPAGLRAEFARDEEDDSASAIHELAGALRSAIDKRDFDSLQQSASRASSDKTLLGAILVELARTLHQEAVTSAMNHELDHAALRSHQAKAVLETHDAVALQAHAQIAVEALLGDLRMALV